MVLMIVMCLVFSSTISLLIRGVLASERLDGVLREALGPRIHSWSIGACGCDNAVLANVTVHGNHTVSVRDTLYIKMATKDDEVLGFESAVSSAASSYRIERTSSAYKATSGCVGRFKATQTTRCRSR